MHGESCKLEMQDNSDVNVLIMLHAAIRTKHNFVKIYTCMYKYNFTVIFPGMRVWYFKMSELRSQFTHRGSQ